MNNSLNFVPYGPVDYKSALVQIMAWCQAGNKPLSEPMMALFADAYIHLSYILAMAWIVCYVLYVFENWTAKVWIIAI